MKTNISTLVTGGLLGITACSGLVLASATTHADNDSATDDVNITVPVACTMTGTIATGQEHTATLQPGTYSGASGSAYANGIGKTTLATFCNDYNGFSIYAIGFTGETEGDNTLVGTPASSGATIPTKVYESTDTTSSWSMKVTKVTDSSTTFNPNNMTITNSFDSWHTVPDDYTKVAEYHASTGSSATDQSLGAKVETTYASYISTTQPADTYTGKVKYVMVHPYNASAPSEGNQITIIYDGNGETFPSGASTNQVAYSAGPMYIANTPQIAKSPNVAVDGTEESVYASDAMVVTPITVTGAAKIKVVINYGVSAGTGLLIVPNVWDGQDFPEDYDMISDGKNDASGTTTYTIDGDAITMFMQNFTGSNPSSDYGYGFYAQVYPIYATEQTDTSPTSDYPEIISVKAGTYTAPPGSYNRWRADIDNAHYDFADESEIVTWLSSNYDSLKDTVIRLHAVEAYVVSVEVRSNETITFFNEEYGTQTVTDTEQIILYANTDYTISTDVGNFSEWNTDSNGSFYDSRANPTIFRLQGDSVLKTIIWI